MNGQQKKKKRQKKKNGYQPLELTKALLLRQTRKNGSQAGREAGDWSRGKGWVGLPAVLEIMSTEMSSEAQSEFSTTTRASCHLNRAWLRSAHTHTHTFTLTHTHSHTYT